MSHSQEQFRRDAIKTYGPPPGTPEQALAHVLCAFADQPDDRMVLQATSNIYGDGVRTGLTMGDLRAIQHQLDAIEQPEDADVVQTPGRRPASELPDWAVAQLSDRGIDDSEVSHFIASSDGRTIAAAVDGKPVHLTRP